MNTITELKQYEINHVSGSNQKNDKHQLYKNDNQPPLLYCIPLVIGLYALKILAGVAGITLGRYIMRQYRDYQHINNY